MADDNRINNGRGPDRSERSERSRGPGNSRSENRTTASTVPDMRSLFFHEADRMVGLEDARTSNQELFQGWSLAAGEENRGPGRSDEAPGQNRGPGRSDEAPGQNRDPGRSDEAPGQNRGPGRSEDDDRGPGRSDDDRGENRGPNRSEDDRGPRRSEDGRRTDENRPTRRAEESEPPGQARKNDDSRRLEAENRLRNDREDGPGRSEDAPGQARKREGSEERRSLMERIREAMRKEETRRQEPAEPARRDPPQNQQNEPPRRPAPAQTELPRKPPVPAQPEPPGKQPAAETVRKSVIVVSAPGQPVRKPEAQAPAAPEPALPAQQQPASRALYKRIDATPRLPPEQSTIPAARVTPQLPQESRLPTPQARLPELPRAQRGEQPMTPAPTPAVRVDRPAPQRADPAPSHATVVSRSSADGAGTQSGGQQESEGRARPTEIARLSAPIVRENRLLSRFLRPGRAELEEELEALKSSSRVEAISKRNRGGQGGGGGQQSSGQSSGQASGGPAVGEAGLEAVDPRTGLPRTLVRPGLQPLLPQLERLFSTAGLAYAAETEETPEFMRTYWIAMAWLSQHQEQHGLSERMCYFGAAMFDGMQGWRRKGQVSEEQVVNRLLAMLAEEGGFLGEHSLRVMTFADAVCEDLNVQDPAIREQVRSGALLRDLGMAGLDYRQLPPTLSEQVQGLRNSGDLHMAGRLADIGALRVPAEIRNKPGPLNADERALMERHPEFGEQLLARFPAFRHLGPIVRAHHERWDGRGYPDGQMGRRIPMASRIIAVSDVFDALTSERPWREAWSYERAVSHVQEGAGTQFDPEVVRAFLRTSRRLKAGGYLD